MKKGGWISILLFVNIILSAYLIYSESKTQGFCIIGSTCETVQNSEYAYLLGIPVVWIGLISFTILLILFYLKENHNVLSWIYNIGIIIAGIYAFYFIAIQAFVIKKLCSTCMIVDTLTIIASFISILMIISGMKKHKR